MLNGVQKVKMTRIGPALQIPPIKERNEYEKQASIEDRLELISNKDRYPKRSLVLFFQYSAVV